MKASYPNLELIEYIFKEAIGDIEEWRYKREAAIQNSTTRFCPLSFEVEVFLQSWGTTATGFDEMADGSAVCAGQAFTDAYTTVIKENSTNAYGVFFDNRLCYVILDANETFFEDLKAHRMKSLSRAKKHYI